MITFRSLVLGLGLAIAAVAPAAAATYNIAFLDTGGASVGSGTFTADTVNFAPITAFSATVLGTTYSSLSAALPSVLSTDFPNPGNLAVSGYAFKPGETIAANTGVLQFDFFAIVTGGGASLTTLWALSPCNDFSCGGGATLGSYTVTLTEDPEPPVVPLPASAALLPLGLGALALIRRRRARAG